MADQKNMNLQRQPAQAGGIAPPSHASPGLPANKGIRPKAGFSSGPFKKAVIRPAATRGSAMSVGKKRGPLVNFLRRSRGY